MTSRQQVFAGIDVGASRTKVTVLDAGRNIIGRSVARSGTDFAATAQYCLREALEMAGHAVGDIGAAVATGYGRRNVDLTRDTKTEISCHAKGCFHYFPMDITIIDIGGQDNKIIRLDDRGRRLNFKMNRKCAAGTGAFLEEMSLRLDIPLEDMDVLARESTRMVELGSYCTVFTATEVLEKIRLGKKVPDIVKGLFASVIKRIMEMDTLAGHVVMTGGVVAHNPYMVTMLEEALNRTVQVPEYPQFTGAVGAALFAMGA
ncbi:MAG: acyl-CoA dehydratase activase [Thermodesulfobacteriota bacterium]